MLQNKLRMMWWVGLKAIRFLQLQKLFSGTIGQGQGPLTVPESIGIRAISFFLRGS